MKLSVEVLNGHIGLRQGWKYGRRNIAIDFRHPHFKLVTLVSHDGVESEANASNFSSSTYLSAPSLYLLLYVPRAEFCQTILHQQFGGYQIHPSSAPRGRNERWSEFEADFISALTSCSWASSRSSEMDGEIELTASRSLDKHLPFPIQIHVFCECVDLSVSSLKIHSSTTTTNDSMTPSLLCMVQVIFLPLCQYCAQFSFHEIFMYVVHTLFTLLAFDLWPHFTC